MNGLRLAKRHILQEEARTGQRNVDKRRKWNRKLALLVGGTGMEEMKAFLRRLFEKDPSKVERKNPVSNHTCTVRAEVDGIAFYVKEMDLLQWRHYLNHEAVIREYHVPYKMYEYDGRHYQVMREWGSAIDKGDITTAMKHFVIPALENMNAQGVYHGDILNHKMKVNYTNILTNGRDYRLIDFGPTGNDWFDDPLISNKEELMEEAMSPETTVEELKAEKERVAIWKKAHSSKRTEYKHFIPPPTPARKKRRAKDTTSFGKRLF